jgi:hypothetical protein
LYQIFQLTSYGILEIIRSGDDGRVVAYLGLSDGSLIRSVMVDVFFFGVRWLDKAHEAHIVPTIM